MKIKIDVVAERVIPSPQDVGDALLQELSGSWTVDESEYEMVDSSAVAEGEEQTITAEFTIEVEVDRISGKFASKDDTGEEILGDIEDITFEVEGVEYTVVSATVRS